MTARLTRRALIGGIAGSAAAAILAACGETAATTVPTAAATVAAAAATRPATTAATVAAPAAAASTPAVAASTSGTAAPASSSPTVAATTAATTAPATAPTVAATVAPTAASTAAPAATTAATTAAGAGTPGVAATTANTPAAAPAATTGTSGMTAATMVNPNLAGRLTVYTSQVQADIDALKAAFNRVYPRVEVSVYRDGTERVIARLRTEAEARAVAADVVFIADAPTMEIFKADRLIQPYISPNAAAVPREFAEAEGYYTGTKLIYTGIAVNTVARPPMPMVWKDLIKPEYRGKLISPSPQYSGAAALNYTAFLNNREYGPASLMALKANTLNVVMSNGDALNRVISGEFPVGIVTDNGVRAARVRMSPVEIIYPADGAIPITEPVAVVAGTKNLDTAKAWIDFVLGADGQNLASMQGYVPLIPTAMRPAGAPATIRPFPLDNKALAGQLADGKKQFVDIFG